MKLERTQNAKNNIVWGLINKVIKIVFPFIIRTIIIYKLGEEYIGLNSLFTSILSALSLTELGFDTAIVTILYRYVAIGDKDIINALVNYIRKAYLIIGSVILVLGCCCLPFLKVLITDYENIPPDINIYVIYLLFLINAVVSYFFGGYKNCVFEAYQRQDITSNINSIVTLIFSMMQIAVLVISKDYYVYLLLIIFSNIALNCMIYEISKRYYKEIQPIGNLSKEHKNELKKTLYGTFMGKVGGVLSTSADNVVISAFLGVTILAYYTNYYYVITALQSVLVTIYVSLQAGIGNSLVLESKEKNYNDLQKFTFMFNWIVGWCSICVMVLFQPFIKMWVGEKFVLPYIVQLLIVLDFYIVMCGSIQGTYKNALAIWWEDRYRCIVSGVVNIVLNVSLVVFLKRFGNIYALIGIVLSTIIADLFISTSWSIKITFKYYFKTGAKKYIMYLLMYFFATCINYLITFFVSSIFSNMDFSSWGEFISKCLVCMVVPNLIYLVIYYKTKPFYEAKNFILARVSKKK